MQEINNTKLPQYDSQLILLIPLQPTLKYEISNGKNKDITDMNNFNISMQNSNAHALCTIYHAVH